MIIVCVLSYAQVAIVAPKVAKERLTVNNCDANRLCAALSLSNTPRFEKLIFYMYCMLQKWRGTKFYPLVLATLISSETSLHW